MNTLPLAPIDENRELRQALELTPPEALLTLKEPDPQQLAHARSLIDELLLRSASSEGQAQVRTAVEGMGSALQVEAGRRSQMLKQPIHQLASKGEEGGDVARALVDLKLKVEELDPAQFDFEAGWFSRMLGHIPGVGTPIKRYFSQYESASTTLDAIMASLRKGQDQLKRDNITLAEDQAGLRSLSRKLEQAITLAGLMDRLIEEKCALEIPSSDPRHAFLQEEVLFSLRQRTQDLQQQLLVTQQGYLTIDLIMRNNKELIRGVDRALNVTVSALQVAVTLALALANQRIVLEKIQALTSTTENLIAATAQRLRTQGAAIQKQASSTMIDMEVLRNAFADIKGALEDIDAYRRDALPKMARTITEMDRMAHEAEIQVQKREEARGLDEAFSIDQLMGLIPEKSQ
jgi:uncharacterized protein YaaN involved in tellurite resistance